MAGFGNRVYLRVVTQEAFTDEANFEVMKKLNSEDDVYKLTQMVLKKIQEKLQEGVNVVLDDFGVLQVRHPKVKTRRGCDVASKKIVTHTLKSKVHLITHFDVERKPDVR